MRVVVLADSHLRRTGARRLPDAAWAQLRKADVILHAGDVLVPQLLTELRRLAPVHAVLGNNDLDLVGALPEVWEGDLAGVRVAMIHDSGPAKGRARRLRRRFPTHDVVVFGHSHQPLVERGLDGQLLVNPGSPTERRRAPSHTVAVLDLDAGEVRRAELVEV